MTASTQSRAADLSRVAALAALAAPLARPIWVPNDETEIWTAHFMLMVPGPGWSAPKGDEAALPDRLRSRRC